MTITAFACAEFHDPQGNVLHRITAGELNQVLFHVPDAIRQDPLFAMMVNEGTIVTAEGKEGVRTLEKAAENTEKPRAAKKNTNDPG